MARNAPKTSPERLAVLETQMEALLRTQEARHAENKARLDELSSGMDMLQKTLARYTGFWGALLLVGGALATLWGVFGDLIRKKLGWG